MAFIVQRAKFVYLVRLFFMVITKMKKKQKKFLMKMGFFTLVMLEEFFRILGMELKLLIELKKFLN